MEIILASSSPRRKELLSNMGVKYTNIVIETSEIRNEKLNFKKQIEQIAVEKATAVFKETLGDRLVISADTMVIIKKEFLGKPKTEEEAKQMLRKLSGKKHKVVTAMCVMIEREQTQKEYILHDVSYLYFKKLTEEMIDNYISTNEPMDKAGAYAIQGIGGMFIERICGCFNSVVGLPTPKLYDILKKENVL